MQLRKIIIEELKKIVMKGIKIELLRTQYGEYIISGTYKPYKMCGKLTNWINIHTTERLCSDKCVIMFSKKEYIDENLFQKVINSLNKIRNMDF